MALLLRSVFAFLFALIVLFGSSASIAVAQEDVPDCNVHPQDNEATAAARIARCAPSLGPAALTAIDRATPVVEPPDLLARRVANAAAAAAAAAGAGGGVGGGGNAEPVAGPGA